MYITSSTMTGLPWAGSDVIGLRFPNLRSKEGFVSSEIVPGLSRLPGVQWVGAYLWCPHVAETRHGVPMLFDCGWPWSGQGLATSLVAMGCYPEEIQTIVITHDDVDHTGRLASLAAVSGATVVAHTVEAQRLTSDHWRRPPLLTGMAFPAVNLLDRLYQRWRHTPDHAALQVEDGALLPGGCRSSSAFSWGARRCCGRAPAAGGVRATP
jgi:hypothetical protein